MNENLDLCLILKDCPKDAKLYCTFLGDVLFSKIEDNKIFIHTSYAVYSFYSDGKFTYEGECVLFPSREQRDWSKFKVPIKKFDPKDFKPFDKVLLRDGYGFKWHPTFLEKILKEPSGEYSAVELINGCKWDMCIPYNEETKNLCWTTNDCPKYYKWWEE